MTPARTSLAAYLLLSIVAALLPMATTQGAGIRTVAGAAVLALAIGYASPTARGIGVALALLGVAVGSGHHASVVALTTGAAVAAVCLVLLRWPTARSGTEARSVLRSLSLELPIGLGAAAGVAIATSARLPVVVGVVAAAGVLAAVGAARRV